MSAAQRPQRAFRTHAASAGLILGVALLSGSAPSCERGSLIDQVAPPLGERDAAAALAGDVSPVSDAVAAEGQTRTALTAQELRDALAESDSSATVVVFLSPYPGPQGPPGEPGKNATVVDHGALGGLTDDDHPQYVREGEPGSVSAGMLLPNAVRSVHVQSVRPDKVSPQGTGSGLDADTVDGLHATDLGPLYGEVRMWAGPKNRVPVGWAVCDGSTLERVKYPALFSVIGTIYGVGDGALTFNLPDFRNRNLVGASTESAGAPLTTVTGSPSQTGGEAMHTLTGSEMPPHNHDMSHKHDIDFFTIGTGGPNPVAGVASGSAQTFQTSDPNVQFTGMTGGGLAHNVMDPYHAIHFIIFTGRQDH